MLIKMQLCFRFLRKELLGNPQVMIMADLSSGPTASMNSLCIIQLRNQQKNTFESWRVSLLEPCISFRVEMENSFSIQVTSPCKLANENQSFTAELRTMKGISAGQSSKAAMKIRAKSRLRCSASLASQCVQPIN